MDEGVPPRVEFLDQVDGSGDGFAAVRPRRVRNVLLVAGALIIALGAAEWARSTNDAPASGTRSARSAPTPPRPAREVGLPPTIGDSPYGLVGPCPAGAQCFVSAPAAATAALRAAFPGAVPVAAASILANRAGHSDPGVLRRVILAQRGQLLIQVRVQAGVGPGSDAPRRPTTPHGVARVTTQLEGYAMAVVVIGPGASATTAQAARLADDVRLLAS